MSLEDRINEMAVELGHLKATNQGLREEVQANRTALNTQAATAAAHVDAGDEDDPMNCSRAMPPVLQPQTKNLMKLRIFFGDRKRSDPWIEWRYHAEDAIDISRWDLDTVKQLVAGSMTGEAGIFAVGLRERVRRNCKTIKNSWTPTRL